MKILIDMNLPPRWTRFLEEAGFEGLHWSQVGPSNARDQEIMAFAAERDFIVLTHDLDFSAILAVTKGMKPSVVQLRAENITPEAVGSQVISAFKLAKSALASGALVTIDIARTRIRLLPLEFNP